MGRARGFRASGMMSASTYRRLALALVLGGLLLLCPPVVSGNLLWDIGIGLGYVSVVLSLFLYVFPVRGEGLPHRRLLGLSQHRVVGWLTLGAALLHVGILLSSQTSVGRYLLPSAPAFMWCGLAALVLAIALVQTGLSTRSAMRRATSAAAPVRLATLHLVFAAMLVITLWAHIIGSAQVISGPIKTITVSLLLVSPLVWFAYRPRSRQLPHDALRRSAQVSAAALILLIPSATTSRLLLEPAAPPAPIEVSFPHDKHTSVNCAQCHHNFLDHTGTGDCIECHRSSRTDLPRSSEATFHVFCRDCHTRLALQGLRHGPTRACSSCHQGTKLM